MTFERSLAVRSGRVVWSRSVRRCLAAAGVGAAAALAAGCSEERVEPISSDRYPSSGSADRIDMPPETESGRR